MSNNFKVIEFTINVNDEVILSRDTLTYLLECKEMRDNSEYGKEVVDKLKIRISDKISEYNQELREQQQRIDRAIEILECSKNIFSEQALNILRGGNKE